MLGGKLSRSRSHWQHVWVVHLYTDSGGVCSSCQMTSAVRVYVLRNKPPCMDLAARAVHCITAVRHPQVWTLARPRRHTDSEHCPPPHDGSKYNTTTTTLDENFSEKNSSYQVCSKVKRQLGMSRPAPVPGCLPHRSSRPVPTADSGRHIGRAESPDGA